MKREIPPQSQTLSTDSASASPARWHLDRIVAELRVSREETHSIRRDGEARRAPSRDALETILNGLTEALFPRHYGQSDLDGENIDYFVGNTLSIVLDSLCDQIHRGALFVGDDLLRGLRMPGPASISILGPRSDRASSLITAPASSSARPRSSVTMCGSTRRSRSARDISRPTMKA